MKEVFAPHLGRNVKFGRRRPVAVGPHLRLKNYLRASGLPTPPPAYSYTDKALDGLRQMYLNDQLGDCVIAAHYHMVAAETGNAGKLFIATDGQIQGDYSAIGGYKPGDPSTDNGCDMQTSYNYYTTHGYADGTRLSGYVGLDASNPTEIMTALYLFENAQFGMELPDAWISPFPGADGFVWDVAGDPDENNGHDVFSASYNQNGALIWTWGLVGTLTWPAIAKYGSHGAFGEIYMALTPDQIQKGYTKAPNGLAWADLVSDFDKMGGHVPIPAPPPPPPPAPPPSPGPASVTLAQAQAWAHEGIRTGARFFLFPSDAIRCANAGLAKNWPKS